MQNNGNDDLCMTIIPQPVSVTRHEGAWIKTHKGHWSPGVCIRIFADPQELLESRAALLGEWLTTDQMFRVEQGTKESCDIHISVSLTQRLLPARLEEAGFVDEQYRLAITPGKIHLEGATPNGVSMGMQTLRQLLSGQRARLSLPCMEINDQPAMAWRGLHLDVSRHFLDAAAVKRFIDLAAYHKFNLFHWHLTDDQGWRLPLDGYPKLTETAAWRDSTLIGHDCNSKTNPGDNIRHGGFYTHDEIREVVAYAAVRSVHVMPEIDVPGHVQALLAAYPEFGNQPEPPAVRQHWGVSDCVLNLEPQTFAFLECLVGTLVELFPFVYVHLGGDEARKTEWTSSERIQQRKHELGIRTDQDVQSYFTRQLAEMLNKHGRKMVGWDEIIEHDKPSRDTAVMYWRDSTGLDRRALEQGHPLILANSSYTYFDHYQMTGTERDFEPLAIGGNLPIDKVYSWQPGAGIPENLRSDIFGAQGQVWTEYIPNRDHLDYMVYPRACALAQVLWTGDQREPMDTFGVRLSAHLVRLDRLGVMYRPLPAASHSTTLTVS